MEDTFNKINALEYSKNDIERIVNWLWDNKNNALGPYDLSTIVKFILIELGKIKGESPGLKNITRVYELEGLGKEAERASSSIIDQYNKDLVSFGEFLLSQKEDSLKSSELPNQPSFEERKRFVFDSDLANWKELNDK